MSLFKKDTPIGEYCYRDEKGKIINYRVLATTLRNFNPKIQTRAFHKLPEVKDLSAKTPKDESGYTGWALHYMYFLKRKGYIGDLTFEKRDDSFNRSCWIERKLELRISNWIDEKRNEYANIMPVTIYSSDLKYPKNHCVIIDGFNPRRVLLITNKDLDWDGLYMKHIFEVHERAGKSSDSSEAYLSILKEKGYISHYEIVDFDEITPLAF